MGVGERSRVEVLSRWLKAHGIKHRVLAGRVRVSPAMIAQILNRHCMPSLEVFDRIVIETGIPAQTLLNDLMGRCAQVPTNPANVTNLQVARMRRASNSH
jgi:transcriptional regulator with XRE-family HTH domain